MGNSEKNLDQFLAYNLDQFNPSFLKPLNLQQPCFSETTIFIAFFAHPPSSAQFARSSQVREFSAHLHPVNRRQTHLTPNWKKKRVPLFNSLFLRTPQLQPKLAEYPDPNWFYNNPPPKKHQNRREKTLFLCHNLKPKQQTRQKPNKKQLKEKQSRETPEMKRGWKQQLKENQTKINKKNKQRRKHQTWNDWNSNMENRRTKQPNAKKFGFEKGMSRNLFKEKTVRRKERGKKDRTKRQNENMISQGADGGQTKEHGIFKENTEEKQKKQKRETWKGYEKGF